MERRNDIDFLKGLAILAVVFYHVGILPFGFLGVDLFLPISGFLLIPKMSNLISTGEFCYCSWLFRHLYRLWPITLAASIVSLSIGYFVMIPDSYENLAESVVASDFFAQNILSAITTKSYWNPANDYKPLMQMWYLGILVQFYVVFPLLLYLFYRCLRKLVPQSWDIITVSMLGFLSLTAFLVSDTQYTQKFYFLQYRIWEFAFGGIAGLIVLRKGLRNNSAIALIAIVIIVVELLFDGVSELFTLSLGNLRSTDLKMVATVLAAGATALILLNGREIRRNIVCRLGLMSLSVFVWHQVILAFVRYSFIETFSWWQLGLYIMAVLVVGYLSYRYIEVIRLKSRRARIIFYGLLFIVTATAFCIYLRAGVVRDVPELGVSLGNPYVNRNTEFIDQFYKADKDFETDKIHVLVIGNSFARDFAGILTKYDTDESLEISYKFFVDEVEDKRLKDADYIFFLGPKNDFPLDKLSIIEDQNRLYGISTKYFGRNFGIFYAKRNQPDYFSLSIPPDNECDSVNAAWKRSWGADHFIDLMEVVKNPDGTIPIFTDNRKVISFDCMHLTPDGCEYFSRLINFNEIFHKQ